jgi:hypothetical protein
LGEGCRHFLVSEVSRLVPTAYQLLDRLLKFVVGVMFDVATIEMIERREKP